MKTTKLTLTTISLLVFVTSCFTQLNAQEYEYVPFPTKNAVWSEVFIMPVKNDGTQDTEYRRFAINGEDTVLESLTYKKVFMFSDSIFDVSKADYIGGIREDNSKRVYYNGVNVFYEYFFYETSTNTNEILLFDFSKKIGDTIFNVNQFPDRLPLIVNNIDTVKIGNTLRKVITFESYFWVKWIEGVGNDRGLLFCSGDLPTNGLYNHLVCFEQNSNNILLSEQFNDCRPTATSYYNSIDKIEANLSAINVYPNPATETFNIQFNTASSGKLTIYNIEGKVMNIIQIKNTQEQNIPVDYLEAGLYIIGFKNNKDNTLLRSTLIIKK